MPCGPVVRSAAGPARTSGRAPDWMRVTRESRGNPRTRARATPTAADLLTATPQQRPERSTELLRQSEERRSDEFDLPPQ